MQDSRDVFKWEVRRVEAPREILKTPSCSDGCELSDGCALAMAYVPIQKFQKIYPSEVGFERGTVFEELDKPFIGRNDC